MISCVPFLLKELISPLNIPQAQLVEDFQELRKTLEAMNMFKANLGFFFLHLAQILALEALAWLMVWHFGNGWPVTICISVLLAVSQVSRRPDSRQWLWKEPQNVFFPLQVGVSCCLIPPGSLRFGVWHQQIIRPCWAQVLLPVKWGKQFFYKTIF